MPNIKAAKKSVRTSERRRIENERRRRAMRKVIKEIRTFLISGDTKSAMGKLPEAYKAIDKAAKKGVLKFNTASRKKARLNAEIKRVSA